MPSAADSINDVRLIFYHPAVDFHYPNIGTNQASDNTLEVRTGANSIKWGYNLNTNKIPTYAGEVVQILSTNVSALRVSGNSRSNQHLMSIYKWFRIYMEIAGSRTHNQQPIKFQYPERGWELGIYVTQLPQVRLARDQVAGEWSIVAEINQDDVPAIEEAVMSQFNYSMPQTLAQMSKNAIVPKGIGFISANPFSQYLPPNTQLHGAELDAWVGGKITATANTIGNSFEALIASWSAGDFLNFAFDVGTGQGTESQTPDQIWTKLFGSIYVSGKPNDQTSTDPATTGGADLHTLSGKLSPEQVAAVMVAAGFPAEESVLVEGVATAYAESTWTVDATNTNTNGSIDRGLFQINSIHAGYDANKLLSDPVYNAQAALAIWHGSGQVWGNSNGTGAPWFGHGSAAYYAIQDQVKAAVKRYIANPGQYDGGQTSVVTPNSVRQAIVDNAMWGVANNAQIGYGQDNTRWPKPRNDWIVKPPRSLPMSTDCSGFVHACYKWANAPCPSGGSQWTGFTGTMVSHGKQIGINDTQPGDFVIFGSGDGDHTALIVQTDSVNPMLVSHGQESDPRKISLRDEAGSKLVRFYTVDGL
jgi:hypothetical protein